MNFYNLGEALAELGQLGEAQEAFEVALVLDETQAIKNPDSQTAQAAYRLSATFRIALSGTPD